MRKPLIKTIHKNNKSLLSQLWNTAKNHTLPQGTTALDFLKIAIRLHFVSYLATGDDKQTDLLDMAKNNKDNKNIGDYFDIKLLKTPFILPSFLLASIRATLCSGIEALIPEQSPLKPVGQIVKGIVNFSLGLPELILAAILVKPVDKMQEYFAKKSASSVGDPESKEISTTSMLLAGSSKKKFTNKLPQENKINHPEVVVEMQTVVGSAPRFLSKITSRKASLRTNSESDVNVGSNPRTRSP